MAAEPVAGNSLPPDTAAVILAGGAARRLGGVDKAGLRLAGKRLLDHAHARLISQAQPILLSVHTRMAGEERGLTLVTDTSRDRFGPLAGILAALDWLAAHRTEIQWLASVPCDTPALPTDFVARCRAAVAATDAAMAVVTSGGRNHPACALWPVSCRNALRRAIDCEGLRRVADFQQRYKLARVDWPLLPYDPFFNINTPEDLCAAEAMLRRDADELL